MNEPDTAQQANWWEMACCSAWPLRFIDFNLRGIGQVMFQNKPLSGLFFFAAIGWGSFMAGALEIAIAGLFALLVASLTALWLRVETTALHAGLYGFNAYLLGIALATFLDPSPLLWVYVVLGGAVSVIATLAATRVMQTWGLSALTAPFILITWLLLSSNGFSSVPAGPYRPAV